MKRNRPLPHRERGMSLVSLLVGAAIGLVVAIAVLQLFKTVTQITRVAKKDTAQDSHLSSALLTSGLMLQSAGFGIEDPTYTRDLLLLTQAQWHNQELTGTAYVLNGGSLPPPDSGYALIWRSNPSIFNTHSFCEALFAPASAQDDRPVGLYHLQTAASDSSCASQIQSAQWVQAHALATGQAFAIEVSRQPCTPLGHTRSGLAPNKHLLVRISANSSAGIVVSENYCLSNFEP